MANNHLDNIIINITLDPAPVTAAGFGVPMIIADGSTSSLDGDRIRAYTSLSAVQVDNTAGFVSAPMLAAATAAFSQTSSAATIKIGRKDALETYAEALAAIEIADADFYGIAIESRLAADALLVSAPVEASSRIFIMQASDATFLTTGFPAAYAAVENRERSIVAWHDTDTEWFDLAWLSNRLVFDPDTRSAPWNAGIQGVTAYATAPTDTQKGFLDSNSANHGLPFGGAAFFVDPGVNANARPIYEIVTADWFEARLEEAVSSLVAARSASGLKIPVTVEGQGLVQSLIETQFALGVAAGHFVQGQTSVTPVAITTADIAAQRLRFTGQAQLVTTARIFQFDLNFSRNPII